MPDVKTAAKLTPSEVLATAAELTERQAHKASHCIGFPAPGRKTIDRNYYCTPLDEPDADWAVMAELGLAENEGDQKHIWRLTSLGIVAVMARRTASRLLEDSWLTK